MSTALSYRSTAVFTSELAKINRDRHQQPAAPTRSAASAPTTQSALYQAILRRTRIGARELGDGGLYLLRSLPVSGGGHPRSSRRGPEWDGFRVDFVSVKESVVSDSSLEHARLRELVAGSRRRCAIVVAGVAPDHPQAGAA